MFADALSRRLAGLLELTAGQVDTLKAHYELLLRWNLAMNLTTVTGLEPAVERHYCESLFLAAHLPPGALRIADIGSGAGFPGFPLAVLRPDCFVTLIESHQRKAVFLQEATRRMANVRVLAVRAEKIDERFDWIVSRAVSYENLSPILKKLAPNAALLTGAGVPPEHAGFAWDTGIALPWGEHRVLRRGRVTIHSNVL